MITSVIKIGSGNFLRWNPDKNCTIVFGKRVCLGGFEDEIKTANLYVEYPEGHDVEAVVNECLESSAVIVAKALLLACLTPVGWPGFAAALSAFMTVLLSCLMNRLNDLFNQIHVELKVE